MKITLRALFFVLCAVAALGAAFFAFNTKSSYAFSSKDYAQKHYSASDISANTQDGITIQIVPASNTNFVSYVHVRVTNWSSIHNFKIKRIVLNVVKEFDVDDASNDCSFDSHAEVPSEISTFLFNQNGYYLIEYSIGETAENAIQKAIYLQDEFNRQFNINAINFSNATKYLNTTFESENANVIVATNGATTISINSDENCQSIYSFEYSTSEITTNSAQIVSIKNGSTILDECSFEVFCKFPSFKFVSSDGEDVEDVLSSLSNEELAEVNASNVLFFNEEATPTLDFTDFSNEQKELFNKRFSLSFEQISVGPQTMQAAISLNSAANTKIVTQKYRINLNPSDNIQLRLGSQTSTTIYPNLTSATKTLYTRADLYPTSVAPSISLDRNESGSNPLVVWGYFKSDTTKQVLFAYKFNYIKYTESDSTITCQEPTTSNPNKIVVTKQAGVQIPIDLTIINQKTSERFEYKDIFQNTNEDSVTITIQNSGEYRVIAAYRDTTLDDTQKTWDHVSFTFKYIANGNITFSTSNGQIISGQTTNRAVTVSSNNNYTVIYNAKDEETYNTTQTFAEEGYYQITCGSNTYNFTIISSNAKDSYIVTSYGNATLKSVTQNNQAQTFIEPIYLTKNGSYTLNYTLKSTLPISIDEESINLETLTDFAYVVNITNSTFSVNANISNGQKTSENVTINSIEANGDFTVTITHNKKSTTYTKDEFNALSKRARTYSRTGTYKITITDENGNQGIFTFEKYYQMNFVLVLLIGIFVALVAIALVILIRLRLKSKVK